MFSVSLPQLIMYAIGTIVTGFGLGIGIMFAKKLFSIGKHKEVDK